MSNDKLTLEELEKMTDYELVDYLNTELDWNIIVYDREILEKKFSAFLNTTEGLVRISGIDFYPADIVKEFASAQYFKLAQSWIDKSHVSVFADKYISQAELKGVELWKASKVKELKEVKK